MNAIANLSYKYLKDVGELTYRVAQEAKRCGFEILEVQREGPTPFAKLTHAHLRTIDNKPVPVRIDINNHHAVFTSRLVRAYVDMASGDMHADPRVEYFLRFIRLWGGCRGVCSQKGALGFYPHTVLALHYLAAAGYVPSILPDHGRTSTPDQAYGRLGARKLNAYNRSSKGPFVDGVDYHFFKHIDTALNMPAEVDLAMRANVLERSVRQKLDPRTNKQEVCEEEEEEDKEEGEGEEAEQEQEQEDEGEGEWEEVEGHGDGEEEAIGRGPDVVVIGSDVLDSQQLGVSSSFGILSAAIGQKDVSDRRSPATIGTSGVKAAAKSRREEGSIGIQNEAAKDHNGNAFESGSTADEKSSAADNGDCHGNAASLLSVSSSSCRQILGWSELLIVDIIQGYFRYYAHKRRGYVGRSFNHHNQVASLRPAMILPKAVWKGQTPGWRTSVEDAFKTYDGRCTLDLGNELDTDGQSRLQNEWNRGVACVERGQEVDVCDLLQPTDADDLDRTAYNLHIEHPRNGVYGTRAFKRIRSKECTRTGSPFKHKKPGRRNLITKKNISSRHSRGSFRTKASPVPLSGVVQQRRGVLQRGQKEKRSTTQKFLGNR
ncbi:unnamed protein product [Ectocarpus fasciculatus]